MDFQQRQVPTTSVELRIDLGLASCRRIHFMSEFRKSEESLFIVYAELKHCVLHGKLRTHSCNARAGVSPSRNETKKN
eukprot:171409-Amphidinium_carterae.1